MSNCFQWIWGESEGFKLETRRENTYKHHEYNLKQSISNLPVPVTQSIPKHLLDIRYYEDYKD